VRLTRVTCLSGIRTPWESRPGWLRAVMSLSPLHAALFALGVWRFRRQFG